MSDIYLLGCGALVNRVPLTSAILRKRFIAAFPIAVLCLTTGFDRVQAQVSGDYQTPQEREFYNTVPGSDDNGTIFDATNPMDFMNRLRRSTAMDDATSPSDAIDEALNALEEENSP